MAVLDAVFNALIDFKATCIINVQLTIFSPMPCITDP